jgi:hypothetical protein
VIYYRVDGRPSSQEELVVLRLLADRMEPRRRVAHSLREDTG